jgi:Flp pilus assembly pilin Flp
VTISIRDERGQAVLEYLLTLIIAVAIIFGGVYQLNSAFKAWASNYFGDYLSCLLETGELPSISGTGGDAGTCNRLFKPFSIAEGRRLAAVGKTSGGAKGQVGNPVAASERRGGGGGGYNGTPFAGGRTPIKPQGNGEGGTRTKINPTNTGSTEVSNYGTPYTGRTPVRPPQRVLISRNSLVDDSRQQTTRTPTNAVKAPGDFSSETRRNKIRPPADRGRGGDNGQESSLTFGDFIRYLIIAAFIIALLMFLGGQALQIGKSMD